MQRVLPSWDWTCEIVRNQEHKVVSRTAERRRGTKALRHSLSPGPLLFSDYLLPHCLTDAGTAEDVRQGAAAH